MDTPQGDLAARALWWMLLPEEMRVFPSQPPTHPYLSFLREFFLFPGHSQAASAGAKPTAYTPYPGECGTHRKNTKKRYHISLDHSNYSFCYWEVFLRLLYIPSPVSPGLSFFNQYFLEKVWFFGQFLLKDSLFILLSSDYSIKSNFSQLLQFSTLPTSFFLVFLLQQIWPCEIATNVNFILCW